MGPFGRSPGEYPHRAPMAFGPPDWAQFYSPVFTNPPLVFRRRIIRSGPDSNEEVQTLWRGLASSLAVCAGEDCWSGITNFAWFTSLNSPVIRSRRAKRRNWPQPE